LKVRNRHRHSDAVASKLSPGSTCDFIGHSPYTMKGEVNKSPLTSVSFHYLPGKFHLRVCSPGQFWNSGIISSSSTYPTITHLELESPVPPLLGDLQRTLPLLVGLGSRRTAAEDVEGNVRLLAIPHGLVNRLVPQARLLIDHKNGQRHPVTRTPVEYRALVTLHGLWT
jgi:hypothetical protein